MKKRDCPLNPGTDAEKAGRKETEQRKDTVRFRTHLNLTGNILISTFYPAMFIPAFPVWLGLTATTTGVAWASGLHWAKERTSRKLGQNQEATGKDAQSARLISRVNLVFLTFHGVALITLAMGAGRPPV